MVDRALPLSGCTWEGLGRDASCCPIAAKHCHPLPKSQTTNRLGWKGPISSLLILFRPVSAVQCAERTRNNFTDTNRTLPALGISFESGRLAIPDGLLLRFLQARATERPARRA